MLEKSSTVVLTQEDLNDFRLGLVSDRVKTTWNFTYEQLRTVIENNDYTTIEN